MKNLIISAALLLALSVSAVAAPKEPINEKVQHTFNQIFKKAHNVSWVNTDKHFEAFFTTDGIKTRATLDVEGNLIQTIRYYGEANLPANVLYHIKKRYKSKEIFGVTEVANQLGVNYRIVLKDDKNYTHINANNKGQTEVVSKYKRGDK